MGELKLNPEKYLAPVIEVVEAENVSLEELVVACFHCDPAGSSVVQGK